MQRLKPLDHLYQVPPDNFLWEIVPGGLAATDQTKEIAAPSKFHDDAQA